MGGLTGGDVQVNPQFYAFRWITLLLTQEFPFPDTVRLWDSLLSDNDGRSNCLLRMCVAMLINVRTDILQVRHVRVRVACARRVHSCPVTLE